MEAEQRAVNLVNVGISKTVMLKNQTNEYQDNVLDVPIMDTDNCDDYSSNSQNKPRSRAALSFMEVKNIVAASLGENEKRCYKVHWKDSWIYEDHLFGCEDIIEEFWREQEKNEKEIQKFCNSAENGVLTSLKKDGVNNTMTNNNGELNNELTVIVVSKDTESEVSVNDETENENHNMIPDWLIARDGIDRDSNIKENEIAWKEELEMKNRIIPKRRNFIDESADDSKENQSMWDEDGDMKGNIVQKKRDMLTCHICGEKFDMVSAIRRHYNTNHPGNKPFECYSCGKRFDRKENLNRHIRIHTGDRRYVCNHCGKGYTDPSGLKKHVLSKHSNLVFSCQFCKATFKSKDSMNRHLTKHLQDYKGEKDDFDVGSKRQLFDDTSTNSKVFLQDNTSDIHTLDGKDITQPMESHVSDHENSSISPIEDNQENFNDSESIEVQFIHLPQENAMSLQSTEEKMKTNIDGAQFSATPSDHTQFVLPLTTEHILRLTSEAKNVQISAEHLKNMPLTEELLKNIPISTEQLKNMQITEEHLKGIPINAGHLKNLLAADENFKNLSLNTEHLKNLPITDEHLKSLAIASESIQNLPISSNQLKSLPVSTEQLKSLPLSTEQFMHSTTTTGQLIAVSVVSPQPFTYSNDKLTNSIPTYSSSECNSVKD